MGSGHRTLALLASVAVVAAAVPLALVLGGDGDGEATAAPERGDPAPDFEARSVTGEVVSLESVGLPVVLHFCGSWNPLCEEDLELLAEVRGRVTVVDVLVDDDPAQALDFYREHGVAWTVVADPDAEVARAYGVHGVPQTFFVGADGRVRARNYGALAPTTLGGRVEDLLAG